MLLIEEIPPIPENVRCKGCGGRNLVRFGKYKGTQKYRCKDCKTVFIGTEAPRGMRLPAQVIADGLSMFYEGLSLSAIRRQLKQAYDIYPSDSSVYGWIVHYTRVAIQAGKDIQPKVGNRWSADEAVLKVGGTKLWFWDVLDYKTRYLLASHLTVSRYTRDAQTVMQRARDRAGKSPRTIITDGLKAYIDGIERVFGADSKHLRGGIRLEVNNNMVERFHGTLRQREKVMRGLKSADSARLFLDGWLVYYNHFRPHESLGDMTPGEAAKAGFRFKNWAEVVRGEVGE
ncbi:MAG: IS6 family transposase [Chloroflexota bacterium]|nr:IS6 family transposase [Chloroflexota bacterium]